jgi:hypothetical protein
VVSDITVTLLKLQKLPRFEWYFAKRDI